MCPGTASARRDGNAAHRHPQGSAACQRGSWPISGTRLTLGRVDPRGFQPGPGSRYLPAFGWYYGRHREPGMSRFWQAELDWPDMWASVSAFRCRYCCRYCCRLLPRAWRRPGERRGHCGGVGGPRVADAAGGPEPGPVHGRLAERPRRGRAWVRPCRGQVPPGACDVELLSPGGQLLTRGLRRPGPPGRRLVAGSAPGAARSPCRGREPAVAGG
jgi:hypothetical protein